MKLVNQTNNEQQNIFTSGESRHNGNSPWLKLIQGMCSTAVFSLCVCISSASVVFANDKLTERPITAIQWQQPDAGQDDDLQSSAMQQALANEAVVQKVNINLANFEQLVALPGIGKVKAEAILNYRKNVGAFNTLADIQNIKGIGSKLFTKLNNLIEI